MCALRWIIRRHQGRACVCVCFERKRSMAATRKNRQKEISIRNFTYGRADDMIPETVRPHVRWYVCGIKFTSSPYNFMRIYFIKKDSFIPTELYSTMEYLRLLANYWTNWNQTTLLIANRWDWNRFNEYVTVRGFFLPNHHRHHHYMFIERWSCQNLQVFVELLMHYKIWIRKQH